MPPQVCQSRDFPLSLSPASSVSLLSGHYCLHTGAVNPSFTAASTCSPDTPLISLLSSQQNSMKEPLSETPSSLLLFKIYLILKDDTVDSQCCANICCTASNSVVHIYTFFSYILFYYGLSQDIIFLCAVYSRTQMRDCTCQPQTPNVLSSLLHFLTLSS